MSLGSIALRLRTVLFWFHLAIGVTAATVILIMSVTGVLLGFERQVIAAVDGTQRVVVPAGAVRLPLDTLFTRAGTDAADGLNQIVIRAEPTAPVTVRYHDSARPGRSIDPYTGARVPSVAGRRALALMQEFRRWHRFVGQQDPRGWGRTATGIGNLVFFLLVLSGLYLWWPRRWTGAIVRSVTVPAFRLSPKAREFNWHHVAGVWMALPLIVVVGSGVFMSFEWPTLWLARIAGERAEAGRGGGAQARERVRGRSEAPSASAPSGATLPDHAPLEPMVRLAIAQRREWTQVQIALPGADEHDVIVTVSGGNTFRPDLRTTVTFDAASGALRSVAGQADLPFARRLRGWIRFAHTGEVLGLGGQTFATLASLAGALLAYTGIALSLRRFAAWRGRAR